MRVLVHLWVLLFAVAAVHGQGFDCSLEPPPERAQDKLVWQYTPFLGEHEIERLDNKLSRFAQETSNRILVLIVDTLCGYPASDLAFEVGERWGIGDARFDNGIVILIQPTGPPGRRESFIAIGYGLEGAIPDLTTKRIIDNELHPRFADRDFIGGLDRTTDVLMGLAKGEFDHESYGKGPPAWPALLFFLGIIVLMVVLWRGQVKRYAATNNVDFWTAMWLLSQTQQRHGRGGRMGGGFGGGGGGGFGGFGGGSFGGGGAGGRW